MAKLKIITIAFWIIAFALAISILMINQIDMVECSNMEILDYKTAIDKFRNFRFDNKASRYAAEFVANYNIKNSKNPLMNELKIAPMTDMGVYGLAIGRVDEDHLLLRQYNHPQYLSVMTNYDSSLNAFTDKTSKPKAISILTDHITIDGEKQIQINALNQLSDLTIYNYLILGLPK